MIEGLSHTGDQYKEAVTCLKNRYDQPRAVHEAYVKVIVEYPKLKEGSGKELRKLHDMMLQNIRAHDTMGYSTDPKFMTSLIQLKLDATTSFAWREASKELLKEVPACEAILKFLDQRARSADDEASKKSTVPGRKPFPASKAVATHLTTSTVPSKCHLCPGEKHPLYYCPKFKTMPIVERRSTLTSRNACFNCLKTGHKASQCMSLHRCKTCQEPHHTLLHLEQETTSHTNKPYRIN